MACIADDQLRMNPNTRNIGDKLLWIILAFFAIVFSSISLLNHFNFRTYGLDYGMFNQALFAYSEGKSALFTQGLFGDEINYLCDHYSPILILLSPIRWIAGTYGLLIVQILVLLSSAFFIYKTSILKGIHHQIALMLSVFSLSFWCVYGALAYDFHTNVILAALLPAMYFYLLKGSYIELSLLVLVGLMCKENSGYILFFFFLVLSIESKLEKRKRMACICFAGFSLLAMMLTLFYLMPNECGANRPNVESFYRAFGNTFSEAIQKMITSPVRVLKLFILDHGDQLAPTKVTTYWFLLLSGGMFVFLKPRFLLLLIPLLMQKFLSTNELLWDVSGHYSIEFAPLLALAAVCFMSDFHVKAWSKWVMLTSIALAFFISWRGVISRNERANVFSSLHYQSEINKRHFDQLKHAIPASAVLSCSSHLAPHLSFRDKVFIFPVVLDADFVLLDKFAKSTYPISRPEFEIQLQYFRVSDEFYAVAETDQLILFERIGSKQKQ